MKIIDIIKKTRLAYNWMKGVFPLRNEFGSLGKNTAIQYPVYIYCPKQVFIEENVKITSGFHVLNSPAEKVFIKKYTTIAANCTLIPNSHVSTVTMPQFLLGASHINDKSSNIIIDEDVWLGTGVMVMAGVHIGRGCIVGAGSIVTRSLPPYSLAIGAPAKIVKKVFSIDQILTHEKTLYSEQERMKREELETNEKKYFQGLSTYGTDQEPNETTIITINKIKKMLKFIEPIK